MTLPALSKCRERRWALYEHSRSKLDIERLTLFSQVAAAKGLAAGAFKMLDSANAVVDDGRAGEVFSSEECSDNILTRLGYSHSAAVADRDHRHAGRSMGSGHRKRGLSAMMIMPLLSSLTFIGDLHIPSGL
jgi:hypothetical protein